MLRKRLIAIAMCATLGLTLLGCGSGSKTTSGTSTTPAAKPADDGKTYTIKVANWHAPEHPINVGLDKFKKDVESKSNGKIKVQIYPNSQLGPEDTYIDSVKKGSVEMGITGTLLGRDVPMINIGELPLLFRDWDHARKVFEGSVGQELTKGLEEKAGVKNLAWYADGWRVTSSNKPLEKFEDFKGFRLRIPNTPTYVEMAKAFGANPSTLPFSEVFTALEQKVVDGEENPYATILSSKFYEVQKYITDTKHMFSPRLFIINEKFFNSLPADYQKIVADAAKESAKYQWDVSIQQEQKQMDEIKSHGTKIIIPDEAFKKKLVESQKPVYDWFFAKYPGTKEMADKISAVK